MGRARMGVAIEPVRETRRETKWPTRTAGVAQFTAVRHEQREQRDRVGTGPFARLPSLIPADRSIGGEAEQRAPAPQFNRAFEARRTAAKRSSTAIGQNGMDCARS